MATLDLNRNFRVDILNLLNKPRDKGIQNQMQSHLEPRAWFSCKVGSLVKSTGLQRPKSDSFMWPSTPSSRLSGLMSLHLMTALSVCDPILAVIKTAASKAAIK